MGRTAQALQPLRRRVDLGRGRLRYRRRSHPRLFLEPFDDQGLGLGRSESVRVLRRLPAPSRAWSDRFRRPSGRGAGLPSGRPASGDHAPVAQAVLGAALAQLGRLGEARSAVKAGLALNPAFTVSRAHASWTAMSDDPTYLAQLEPIVDGLRKACLPEE
jgi:hypothetical protein